jgi:hypothetical protein
MSVSCFPGQTYVTSAHEGSPLLLVQPRGGFGEDPGRVELTCRDCPTPPNPTQMELLGAEETAELFQKLPQALRETLTAPSHAWNPQVIGVRPTGPPHPHMEPRPNPYLIEIYLPGSSTPAFTLDVFMWGTDGGWPPYGSH